MIIQHGACALDVGLHKTRNTNSEYIEHIRFPHQQQLHIPTTMSFL